MSLPHDHLTTPIPLDSDGIKWMVARGQITKCAQTRDESDDKRWSKNFTDIRKFGYEVTAYFDFDSIDSGGHFALKFWGPNHSSPCGHSESGDCCCWYDTGIRSNGNVQLETERPHPDNHDIPASAFGGLSMTNIGASMSGNLIGLKWLVHPIKENGNVDNGGMHLVMWKDTSGFSGGLPQNNWVLIYDVIDTGQILGDYPAPSEQEAEIRVSGGDLADDYVGMVVRRLQDGDATGGGTVTPPPPPPTTPSGGTTLAPDLFGIRRFFATKPGGREWFSTAWSNANPRTLQKDTFDPDDLVMGFHSLPDATAKTMVIDGVGIASFPEAMVGENSRRVFIKGPWTNTEMTVYIRYRTAIWDTFQMRSRSNHHGTNDEPYGYDDVNQISCGFGNYEAIWGSGGGQTVRTSVEVIHDLYSGPFNSVSSPNPGINAWIGHKLITRTVNGQVICTAYTNRDIANQEAWIKESEFVFTGTNVTISPTGFENKVAACIAGGGGGATIGDNIAGALNANTLWLNPGYWQWLRINGGDDVDLKFFSIREIIEPAETPNTGILTNSDIQVRLSGGTSNIDPFTSKGGIKSTTSVDLNNILHNLFSDVPPDQMGPGITKHRLVYLHNNSSTNTMKNAMVFVLVDSESLDTALFYGKAVAPVGEFETVIVNEIDEPPGVTFQFGDTITTGINMGDLPPQSHIGLWLKLVVQPGADPYPEDKAFIRIVADPGSASSVPGGGTGGGGVPVIPPDEPPVQTTPTYSIVVVGDLSTNSAAKSTIAKMKGRNPALIFINGDVIYADNANSLKSELGTAWVAKTKISLGNHDVDESEAQPQAKNSLKSTFNMPGDYYTFTLNNLFGVVMNSEISNSTSSAQYTNLKPKLEAAAGNSAVEWIFIFNHRPIYGPSSNHPNNENNEIQNWHAVWDVNKVAVVWQSHNHNLWCSRPLKKGSGTTPTQTSSANTEYVNPTGEIFVGSGAGGRSHYGIDSVPSYVTFDNDGTYGYWLVDFYDNPRKAVFRCFSNSDALLKTFTILRGGASKYAIFTMTSLGFDGSTAPTLANDDSMDTMWQHTVNPTWLQADLGATKVCSFVDIAWSGTSTSQPIYTFNIQYSIDGTTWITIINDRNSSVNLGLERYTFPGSVSARYIRVNVKGNNVSSVAAILELDVGRLT